MIRCCALGCRRQRALWRYERVLITPELGCQAGTEAVGDVGEGVAVDYVEHFLREVAAFEAAGWLAAGSEAAPAVASCPEWVVTDLVLHLGLVHGFVARVISERMQEPPGRDDRSWLGLAGEWRGWLPPGRAPRRSPVPSALLGWFHAGAADLQERFRAADPGERVW